MTIPKEAIEKAIEGGWHLQDGDTLVRVTNVGVMMREWQVTALSLSFWQCLGKALEMERRGMWYVKIGNNKRRHVQTWEAVALHFYDLILTGGDTDAFWRELLN
jgi:hypothetical protein